MSNKERLYKCLDVDSNSKAEIKQMGYPNPYGYSFEPKRKKQAHKKEIKTCYDEFIPSNSPKK